MYGVKSHAFTCLLAKTNRMRVSNRLRVKSGDGFLIKASPPPENDFFLHFGIFEHAPFFHSGHALVSASDLLFVIEESIDFHRICYERD